MNSIKYIADESHYKDVLSLVGKAKRTVWIGTADIKDLYVDDKPVLDAFDFRFARRFSIPVRLSFAR